MLCTCTYVRNLPVKFTGSPEFIRLKKVRSFWRGSHLVWMEMCISQVVKRPVWEAIPFNKLRHLKHIRFITHYVDIQFVMHILFRSTWAMNRISCRVFPFLFGFPLTNYRSGNKRLLFKKWRAQGICLVCFACYV